LQLYHGFNYKEGIIMGLYFKEVGKNNRETIVFLHAGMSSGGCGINI
jgi:hypothetical protein